MEATHRSMASVRSASQPLDLPPYSRANPTLPTIEDFGMHGTPLTHCT